MDPSPSPVAQTVGDNALPNNRSVELPDVAGGDALRHIPTPNMLSAIQVSEVAEVNVGLSGKIGNPDGLDNWDAFLCWCLWST